MSIVCITNDVPELRPCVVPKEHAANCRGMQWSYDRDQRERVMTSNECRGCLPVPAEYGLLCFSCWEKLRDGLGMAVDVITHLRSVSRAAQLDNAGVRSPAGWVIPIPNTWRTADDLLVLLGHPTPGFPSTANVWEVQAITERVVEEVDPAAWASRVDTATAAVKFNALMHSALIQHPMEDYEHRVRNVRCFDCKQTSLLWKPPLMYAGDVRVECTNPACDFVVDQTGYAQLTAIELNEVKMQLSEEKRRARDVKAAARKAHAAALKAEADR